MHQERKEQHDNNKAALIDKLTDIIRGNEEKIAQLEKQVTQLETKIDRIEDLLTRLNPSPQGP